MGTDKIGGDRHNRWGQPQTLMWSGGRLVPDNNITTLWLHLASWNLLDFSIAENPRWSRVWQKQGGGINLLDHVDQIKLVDQEDFIKLIRSW